MDPTDPRSEYDAEALFGTLQEHWAAVPEAMDRLQRDLHSRTVEGHDHDRVVSITLSGDRTEFSIALHPDALRDTDAADLARRIEAAWADAGTQLDQLHQSLERDVENAVIAPIERVNHRFQEEQNRLARERIGSGSMREPAHQPVRDGGGAGFPALPG